MILGYRFNITGLRSHGAKTGGYEIVFSDTTMCGAPLIRGKAEDFMARLGVIYSRTMISNLGVKVGDLAPIQYLSISGHLCNSDILDNITKHLF